MVDIDLSYEVFSLSNVEATFLFMLLLIVSSCENPFQYNHP